MTDAFNARRARANRPCPLWVDAFQRDTQHLGADEVGAYLLILMAMWGREACDFPDDEARLAKVSRVSLRLWKSRIGPVLVPFFKSENGALFSKRLREEAAYVERHVTNQSSRRIAEKSDKSLKDMEPCQSADDPRQAPTQLPNNPTEEEEEGGAQARGDDLPPPPPPPLPVDEVAEAVMAFNAAAERVGWPKAQKITDARRVRLKARLSDAGGIKGWHIALAKAEASDLCAGRKTRWKADLDFLLQESSFVKLLEGSYDNTPPPPSPRRSKSDDRLAAWFDVARDAPEPGMAGGSDRDPPQALLRG